MTFNLEILPERRQLKPLGKPGCTEAEKNLLWYVASTLNAGKNLRTVNTSLTIGDSSGMIKGIHKAAQFGVETVFIIESTHADWEGLILQSPLGSSPNNVLRYMSRAVHLVKYEDSKLEKLLTSMEYGYPSQAGQAIDLLIGLLATKSTKVGEYFEKNTAGFDDWIKSNHPQFAGVPWPTNDDLR